MSNQPAPPRPWFRLPSIARPAAPAPTPTPEPPPPQPRPALARPSFRLSALPQPVPTQPQEPTPAPPPSAATVPPPVAAPPREPVPPAAGIASVPTSPAVKAAGGVASLPTSPAPRAPAPSSSVPTSPVPTSRVFPPTTFSLPPSPTLKPSRTSSSVPTSPASTPARSASVSTSPSTRPASTTSSAPSSPAPKPATVTSSVPNSPATKAVTTSAARVPGPTPSLRIVQPTVQTPPQSPKPKPTAPPPSPLILPPSRVKSDADLQPKIPLVAGQKTVLVQKIIDKPKEAGDSLRAFANSLSSGIARLAKQETAKDQTKEKDSGKKISSDSEDGGMRVITIAGENKGAFMEVIRSPKKHFFEGNSHTLHKKGNPRSEGSDWGSRSSSGEEDNSKKNKNHKGRSMGPSPMSAFVNSNVQGVNNSIVYNSSCSHHDPGVHVAHFIKPSGSAGFHVKDRGNGYQS
ncbi:hypothetical protein NC652_033063 [Populus alba x Populus x berolinensis]|uniref:Vegetative cell wall protein gp1-like n=1 Tax=Populus tomentosa TaxID=118781 RepID=A0A8X7YBD5_POPTO|nr:hypothetical protein POTOM_046715 [Populus tomentosa]KAJ6879647.1 hypothetical protein NC652_033063 [Populus alba x Populus x berolinensis]